MQFQKLGVKDTANFEEVTGEKKPGDILFNNGHVAIYVGNNQTIGSSRSSRGNTKGPFYERTMPGIVRIKPDAASKITNLTYDSNLLTGGGFSSFAESEFYYNGIPDGKYSVTAGLTEWVIPTLAEILDYILGIITLAQRMVIVGYAAIIENVISMSLLNVDNDENNNSALEQDPTTMDTESKVTIESIIFNNVDFLDINFFDLEETTPETE